MPDYSTTPLAKKLGVKAGTRLLTIGAPGDFLTSLAPLPEGVVVLDTASGPIDVAVVFCTKASELQQGLALATRTLDPDGGVWIAWPKKSSRIATELGFDAVQAAGLALGLVDNKSCSIDTTHSGLRFVVRRGDRPAWAAGQRVLRPR